jgi:hypothetical protein
MVVGLDFLLWVVFWVDLLRVRVMVMVMVGLLLWVALLHGRLLGRMGLLHGVAGLVCLLWVVVWVGFLMGKMRVVPDVLHFIFPLLEILLCPLAKLCPKFFE